MLRKIWILVSVLLLTGCFSQNQSFAQIPHERYTEAVKTVAVQLTKNAVLTPSITPTNTPEPTSTITSTPEPSPTVPTPTATWYFHEKGEILAPILVYYHIASSLSDNPEYDPENPNNLSPEIFQQQLASFKAKGYETIPVSLLVDAILFGAEIPQRPLLITFDVTSAGIYNHAFPILQEAGYTGILFLTVNQIGQEGMLTAAQIEEMITAGWEIGSRGMNGYNLTANYDFLSNEIFGSKTQLEEMFDVEVRVFAYPYGRTDDIILPRVSAWGYQAAMGLTWYENSKHSDQNIFYLSRFEVLNSENIDSVLENLPW